MKSIINLSNLTIGSDPEFFIVQQDGTAFPSTQLLNGTKEHPEDMGNGYAILKDNVLVEANIPPAKNEQEFIDHMRQVKAMINTLLNMRGLALHSADSMTYDKVFLQDPEANEFGCSAYKNGWQLGSFSAEDMSHLPKRVAGFHIHIGYEILDKDYSKMFMNRMIARAFDYFVVAPARMHFNDEFRAKYYGIFGVYRDCTYGVECRALGGHFTDDKYLSWVYKNTIKALEFCSVEENIEKLQAIEAPDLDNMEAIMGYYEDLEINVESLLIKEEEHATV